MDDHHFNYMTKLKKKNYGVYQLQHIVYFSIKPKNCYFFFNYIYNYLVI